MKRYIALLRGINVGGHRPLKMDDLKVLCRTLGLENVSTYIQSGNVFFDAHDKLSSEDLSTMLKEAIAEKYDYDVPVIVLPAPLLETIKNNNPYLKAGADPKLLHVTFLGNAPESSLVQLAKSKTTDEDQIEVEGQVAYLKISGSYHKTKLSNQFFEQQLQTTATTRNWKTVLKLATMTQSDK
ncbi:MAG: hypothetical protein CL843_14975 [Crocinitomicaceae bacterium]|nr:hypothetical protein [Crocinitomicaceae bacterium]